MRNEERSLVKCVRGELHAGLAAEDTTQKYHFHGRQQDLALSASSPAEPVSEALPQHGQDQKRKIKNGGVHCFQNSKETSEAI